MYCPGNELRIFDHLTVRGCVGYFVNRYLKDLKKREVVIFGSTFTVKRKKIIELVRNFEMVTRELWFVYHFNFNNLN